MSDVALRQCMGGWCRLRDRCEHYTARPAPGLVPSERLCEAGHDDPVRATRAAEAAEVAMGVRNGAAQ